MKNPRPDRSALAVAIVFGLVGWGLLIREAISAGDLYTRYTRFRDLAHEAATELLRIDPDNATALAVIGAVERDVDPMEER